MPQGVRSGREGSEDGEEWPKLDVERNRNNIENGRDSNDKKRIRVPRKCALRARCGPLRLGKRAGAFPRPQTLWGGFGPERE